MKQFEQVEVTSRDQWRTWLTNHYTQNDSIWLITYKKHTGSRYLPYDAIIDK
ncbi:MAG: hypothetical protein AAF579_14130 [Cyanobacteria bacterium P01_C01_bin.118]